MKSWLLVLNCFDTGLNWINSGDPESCSDIHGFNKASGKFQIRILKTSLDVLRAFKTRLVYRHVCAQKRLSSDRRLNSLFNYLACLSRSHTLIITTMENSVKFAFDVETHDVLYNTLVLLPLPHVWRQSRTNNCVCIPPLSLSPVCSTGKLCMRVCSSKCQFFLMMMWWKTCFSLIFNCVQC